MKDQTYIRRELEELTANLQFILRKQENQLRVFLRNGLSTSSTKLSHQENHNNFKCKKIQKQIWSLHIHQYAFQMYKNCQSIENWPENSNILLHIWNKMRSIVLHYFALRGYIGHVTWYLGHVKHTIHNSKTLLHVLFVSIYEYEYLKLKASFGIDGILCCIVFHWCLTNRINNNWCGLSCRSLCRLFRIRL